MSLTYSISKEDILSVAESINAELSEKQIDYICSSFKNATEDDPTANWSEVVCNLIYEVKDISDDKLF